MRKLHPPVWAGLNRALTDVFVGGFPADKVIQRQLKANPKWGSGDRRLFAEATYDVVRWWRRLRDAIGVPWSADDGETPAAALPRVLVAWCLLNDVVPAPSLERPRVNEGEVRARWADVDAPRAIRESIPDWLDRWGEAELGAGWGSTLAKLNETAPVFLRANRLRADPPAVIAELAREGIVATAAGADGVRLTKRANVFLTSAFRRGWFEAQDLHSQLVARMVEPRPGERVIDACAGAGGKSLHLAALMQNRGRVLALDVGEKKLLELSRRAKRAGATCVETRLISGTKVIKRLADSADRVLLDVPCSGLGILRRNPDAKWRLSAADVARVRDVQADIFARYAGMCRAGGTLVYATCSIMPSENERQVERFLSRNETWSLEGTKSLAPSTDGGDGFFIARLSRRS